jgi:hypothetical protein
MLIETAMAKNEAGTSLEIQLYKPAVLVATCTDELE